MRDYPTRQMALLQEMEIDKNGVVVEKREKTEIRTISDEIRPAPTPSPAPTLLSTPSPAPTPAAQGFSYLPG